MTEFFNSYVNNMFDLSLTEPFHAPCRAFVSGSIPKKFDCEEFTSKNLASFSKMASRTLKSESYSVGIVQIDDF